MLAEHSLVSNQRVQCIILTNIYIHIGSDTMRNFFNEKFEIQIYIYIYIYIYMGSDTMINFFNEKLYIDR